MNNQNPNCYLLSGSEYLKKDERHSYLVAATLFDGWLIPFSCKENLKDYEKRFTPREVYDPVIDECKEVQQY